MRCSTFRSKEAVVANIYETYGSLGTALKLYLDVVMTDASFMGGSLPNSRMNESINESVLEE